MRLLLILLWLSLLTAPAWAAPPGAGTLAERLQLGRAPGLDLTVVRSDAETARYRVNAPETLRVAVEAAGAYLLGQGWQGHPNVREPAAPPPGVRARVQSYVQGSELLELRASGRAGRAVVLEATLLEFGGPPQLAAAP